SPTEIRTSNQLNSQSVELQTTSSFQKGLVPRTPEIATIESVDRHCQMINDEITLPVNCHFSHQGKHSELVLYFGHFDNSHYYMAVLSPNLIAPYCYIVNRYQQKGSVIAVLYDTQIQRHYSCRDKQWGRWESLKEEQLSPFVQFTLACTNNETAPFKVFTCAMDWFQDIPVLVLSFTSMNDVDQRPDTPMNKTIKRFCHVGLKHYGEALYLMEVPSFNLAKVTHCNGQSSSEWFPIDDEKEAEADREKRVI
ncbi:MAG: hypothetical protein ACTH7F_15650, partial [Vibrio casei]